MRKSRKKCVGVDRSLYRVRNLVERRFNELKNARRVATRYDKTVESFLDFIDITSIHLWVRHLSTCLRQGLRLWQARRVVGPVTLG